MIKKQTPLTLSEVSELLGKTEKEEKMSSFIKQFNKMSVKKAQEMTNEIKALDLIKLKDENIVKIVDFMPEDAADLAKVVGPSLDQDEVNKILEIVKKY